MKNLSVLKLVLCSIFLVGCGQTSYVSIDDVMELEQYSINSKNYDGVVVSVKGYLRPEAGFLILLENPSQEPEDLDLYYIFINDSSSGAKLSDSANSNPACSEGYAVVTGLSGYLENWGGNGIYFVTRVEKFETDKFENSLGVCYKKKL